MMLSGKSGAVSITFIVVTLLFVMVSIASSSIPICFEITILAHDEFGTSAHTNMRVGMISDIISKM